MKAGIQRLAFIIMLAVIAFANVYGQATTIQMHRENSGTYTVPCTVNGLPLRFIFDTGASTVCISSMEAIFMLKNGYLKQSDIKGRSYSQVASGAIVEGMTVNLKTVEIGGLKQYNVEAAVVNSLSAPLLFGQSAIQKLGPIKLDGDKLIIGKVNVLNEEQRKNKAHEISYRAALATQSGRYEDALELYNQANSLYPTADAYDGLCEVYAKLGNKEEAIKASEHAVSLEPANYNYVYNYAVSLYQNDNLDAAERFFKEAYNIIDNNKRPAGTYKGQIVYAYSEREVFILQTCCIYLGELYQTKKMTDKAVLWYKRAGNALDERNNAIANLRLGDIAFDSVQYRKAIEYYKIGVAEEPERPSNLPRYYKMGTSYRSLNNTDSALICFTKAHEIYADMRGHLSAQEMYDDFREQWVLGLASMAEEGYISNCLPILLHSDDISQKDLFDKISKLNELYSNIVNDGGSNFLSQREFYLWLKALSLTNDTTRFDAVSDIATKQYPDDDVVLYASTLRFTNSLELYYRKLIPIYNQVIKIHNSSSDNFFFVKTKEVYYNLSNCYIYAKKYQLAKDTAEKGILSSPYVPLAPCLEVYGEAAFYLMQYDECINAMTKSIKESKDMKNTSWLKKAYEYRGRAYIKIGKTQKGERDLERSKQYQ